MNTTTTIYIYKSYNTSKGFSQADLKYTFNEKCNQIKRQNGYEHTMT